jgi:hypothetical protein
MILHFSPTTTPQSFCHFDRTPSGSIGDLSAYYAIIIIMPCCILFKDLMPLSYLFLGLGCFSYVTKALSSRAWGNNCWAHQHGGGFYGKRLRESFIVLQLYKLEGVSDVHCLLPHWGWRGEGDSYSSEPPAFLLPSLGDSYWVTSFSRSDIWLSTNGCMSNFVFK